MLYQYGIYIRQQNKTHDPVFPFYSSMIKTENINLWSNTNDRIIVDTPRAMFKNTVNEIDGALKVIKVICFHPSNERKNIALKS